MGASVVAQFTTLLIILIVDCRLDISRFQHTSMILNGVFLLKYGWFTVPAG